MVLIHQMYSKSIYILLSCCCILNIEKNYGNSVRYAEVIYHEICLIPFRLITSASLTALQ
jgi:hypothetical protein